MPVRRTSWSDREARRDRRCRACGFEKSADLAKPSMALCCLRTAWRASDNPVSWDVRRRSSPAPPVVGVGMVFSAFARGVVATACAPRSCRRPPARMRARVPPFPFRGLLRNGADLGEDADRPDQIFSRPRPEVRGPPLWRASAFQGSGSRYLRRILTAFRAAVRPCNFFPWPDKGPIAARVAELFGISMA